MYSNPGAEINLTYSCDKMSDGKLKRGGKYFSSQTQQCLCMVAETHVLEKSVTAAGTGDRELALAWWAGSSVTEADRVKV